MPSQKQLKIVAAAWGGIGLATLAARALKRWKEQKREKTVAAQGGLLPGAATVVEALAHRAAATPNELALVGADGAAYTWAQYLEEARAFGKALVATGGATGGAAVHAFNEPRWFFAALGALAAGWTVSGIYTTNTYEQAAHILRTSGVKVLVLQSEEMLETTYASVLQDFPALTVVLLQGAGSDWRAPSYAGFVAHGAGRPLPDACDPEAVASLVYTSGTTGNPKAVELTHKAVKTVCAMMHARIPLGASTIIVSYLPLSHIAAMGIDVFSAVFCGARVHFADADALKGSLKKTLLEVRPTLFFGVPRVWEKMAAAMQKAAKEQYGKPVVGPVKKAIGTAAKAVGAAWWAPGTPEVARGALAPFMGLFKKLAFAKIRRACGLDRCALLYTGAAPLPADTHAYLRSVDMPLLEVFGMSESCGAIAVCGPLDGARPLGACGAPLPLGTLEIGGDGEVLWAGANVMRGYKGLAAATAETVDPQTAQLHTGDLGSVDALGYLHITGRKKDLIITAGGENVAPTPIEEALGGLIGGAGHVVVVGDRKKYLTVLVAPPEDGVPPAEAVVAAAIENYNGSYAKSRAQTIQKAHVLDKPFSVGSGALTPTMKLRRSHVIKVFAAEIEAMYAGSSLVSYSTENILELAAKEAV